MSTFDPFIDTYSRTSTQRQYDRVGTHDRPEYTGQSVNANREAYQSQQAFVSARQGRQSVRPAAFGGNSAPIITNTNVIRELFPTTVYAEPTYPISLDTTNFATERVAVFYKFDKTGVINLAYSIFFNLLITDIAAGYNFSNIVNFSIYRVNVEWTPATLTWNTLPGSFLSSPDYTLLQGGPPTYTVHQESAAITVAYSAVDPADSTLSARLFNPGPSSSLAGQGLCVLWEGAKLDGGLSIIDEAIYMTSSLTGIIYEVVSV